MRWVTSLAPMMMTATSGSGTAASAALELALEAGGLGADDGDVGDLDRAAAEGRDAVGDRGADRLVRMVDAEARGGRVAEHDEPDRLARAGAVGAAVDGGALEALADDAAGHHRLDAQDAVAEGAEGAETGDPDPAAVGGGLGDPARASCTPHPGPPPASVLDRSTTVTPGLDGPCPVAGAERRGSPGSRAACLDRWDSPPRMGG